MTINEQTNSVLYEKWVFCTGISDVWLFISGDYLTGLGDRHQRQWPRVLDPPRQVVYSAHSEESLLTTQY